MEGPCWGPYVCSNCFREKRTSVARPSPPNEGLARALRGPSHDEGLVVFGASRHLVGVDCMRCAPRGRVWTVKESFVKALGTGMYIDPQRLECSFDVSGIPTIRLDGAPQTEFSFRLEEEEAPGYVICICVGPHTRALPEYRGCMPRVRRGAPSKPGSPKRGGPLEQALAVSSKGPTQEGSRGLPLAPLNGGPMGAPQHCLPWGPLGKLNSWEGCLWVEGGAPYGWAACVFWTGLLRWRRQFLPQEQQPHHSRLGGSEDASVLRLIYRGDSSLGGLEPLRFFSFFSAKAAIPACRGARATRYAVWCIDTASIKEPQHTQATAAAAATAAATAKQAAVWLLGAQGTTVATSSKQRAAAV
ncbi:hypothetical protein Emag_005111 [Eimeria magna]